MVSSVEIEAAEKAIAKIPAHSSLMMPFSQLALRHHLSSGLICVIARAALEAAEKVRNELDLSGERAKSARGGINETRRAPTQGRP
jgi:hypothetical protein